MPNTIPNLDAMSEGELMAFWKRYNRPSRKNAETLIGDRRAGFTRYASALANYACNKAVAMKCRREGRIEAALTYEYGCDLTYEQLPEDLRW